MGHPEQQATASEFASDPSDTLRLPKVRQRTGLGRSTIYRLIAQGQFPSAVQLAPRAVGCPPQYTRAYDGPHGTVHTCDYDGAISVTVDGVPFARTWWSTGGDSVTDFSPAAKTQLGTWDKRFDDEFAAWLANQPSAAPQN